MHMYVYYYCSNPNQGICFDHALGALLCDQGLIKQHICCCFEGHLSSFSLEARVLLTIHHTCQIKHSTYIQESGHIKKVSQYNTDYNMVSENGVTE